MGPRLTRYGTLLGSLALAAGAAGQAVQTPLPDRAPRLSELPTLGRSQLGPAPVPVPFPLPVEDPFRWGPVHVRPHMTYRYSASSGLQARPGQSSDSAIQEVSPGVLLDLGDRWRVDYTPSVRAYSNSAFQDSTDHSVMLSGGTAYRNWVLGLSQAYARTSQLLVETASQAQQENFATGLNATCELTEALSLQLGVSQSLQSANQSIGGIPLNSSRAWSTTDWLNYQLRERLGVGFGLGFGYDELETGSNTMHEQVQGRVNWRLGDRLDLSFSGGIEDRQYLNSGTPNSINPIFGVSIHSPLRLPVTQATTFSLQVNRTMSTSALQNALNVSTEFAGTLSQRLLERLFLTLNAGYRMTSYESTTPGLAIARRDNSLSYGARLSTAFLKRATAAVFYQGSENTSGQAGFSYASRQVGLEIGYRF